MDAHPDDLSETECRLSAWKPTSDGLDTDAMLFAAGAAVRPPGGRTFWPALSGTLAVLVVLLAGWGMAERRERLSLARQLPSAPAAPITVPPESPRMDEELAPTSLLAARRAVEGGLDEWPAGVAPVESTNPLPLELPVLRVGQRNALLDP